VSSSSTWSSSSSSGASARYSTSAGDARRWERRENLLPYHCLLCYQSQSQVCVFVRLCCWQKKLFNLRIEMLPRRGREFWIASQWLSPWWAARSFYRRSARYAVTLQTKVCQHIVVCFHFPLVPPF